MVTCDKCKKNFTPKIRTYQIDKDTEEVFFNCPKCNERYTAYYLNNKIKKMQERVRALTAERAKLKNDIEKEMNRLEREYKR